MSAWVRVGETLRPKPFRGDLIAAGAVALSVGVALLDTRVQDDWGVGLRFLVVAVFAVTLLALAWLAPVEGDTPRAYVSVLLVAAFPLVVIALLELADLLGGSPESAGSVTWTALVVAALYAVAAVRRGSSICTLLATVAVIVALMAAWSWVFDPSSPTPFEWLSMVAIAALTLGAVVLRDHHRRHAVALVDAAGLTALFLAALVGFDAVLGGLFGEGLEAGAPWGWKLVLAAVGFGLVAYGAVDRERGPAWLGAAVLAAFVVIAGDGELLWWPAILLVVGVGAIVAGLRPTTSAPPSPDADAPEAPMRRFDPEARR